MSGWYRRWTVFVPGVIASLLPALLLTNAFAQRGHYLPTLAAFWAELVVGPTKYWLPILLGNPRPDALHPMPGFLTSLYAVCLPLTFAHPLWPRVATGCVTVAAFAIWYGWACLTLAAFEY
jgi:hypothetical protein